MPCAIKKNRPIIDQALQHATTEMLRWLAEDYGLDARAASHLMGQVVRYDVGNVGRQLKNLSLYLSGTNLFVITKFSGFDPEVNIDKNNNNYPSRSIEYIPYPTARTITFGLNFSL